MGSWVQCPLSARPFALVLNDKICHAQLEYVYFLWTRCIFRSLSGYGTYYMYCPQLIDFSEYSLKIHATKATAKIRLLVTVLKVVDTVWTNSEFLY